ncbi:MAG TPA: hypothetical protein VGN14_13290 [Candidatus Elarobacter sp.]|jgi:hypothetical protein
MTPSTPTPILFRTIGTIMRFGGWIAVAWLVFYVARLICEILVWHRVIPAALILSSIPYNLMTVFVGGVVISALVFVPGAYVVWAKPGRRFWAEALPWWKGMIPAGTVGLVMGIVFGVLARPH